MLVMPQPIYINKIIINNNNNKGSDFEIHTGPTNTILNIYLSLAGRSLLFLYEYM